MSTPLRIRQIQLFPLQIPLRFRFEHAAASRDTADPVLVELAAATPHAQHAGFGETLARPYVTGESAATVVEDIRTIFAPRLLEFRPVNFTEALEFIDALPMQIEGRIVAAARAAVELALLDLSGRVFRRRAADAAGWLGLAGFGSPGCLGSARYSGIIVGRNPRKLIWALRAQRWYGLRDFKIKVATPGWEERLTLTHQLLARRLTTGRATLRVDANGGWSVEAALAAAPLLHRCGVCVLEQPLPDEQDAALPDLARQSGLALMPDESLITERDAQRLIAAGGVRVLNIRVAKNGGLLPSLRIARLALAAGLDVQLGCLVGETSLLSAAGVAFLESCPSVRFVEGAFGLLLLKDDITRRPVAFGFGGRLKPRRGFGLGVDVDGERVRRLAERTFTLTL